MMRTVSCAFVLLFSTFWLGSDAAAPVNFTLGVLHPGDDPNGWPVGYGCLAGIKATVDAINADNSVLPNTFLKIEARDTSCNAGKALIAGMEFIQSGIKLVVGTGCSSAAMAIAPAFAEMKIPMVSYANSHPNLSEKSKFPWFFRAAASDGLIADASVNMMLALGWKTAATISDLTWFAVTTRFVNVAREKKVTVLTQTAVMDPAKASLSMKDLQKSKAKIFFVICYKQELEGILASGNPILGPKYAWFAPEWILQVLATQAHWDAVSGWMQLKPKTVTACFGKSMKTTACAEGTRYSTIVNNIRTGHGAFMTEDQWHGVGFYMPGTVDSADVAAYALDSLFKAGKFPSSATFQDDLLDTMKKIGDLNLVGAQNGKLAFDKNHDMNFPFEVMNILKGGKTSVKVADINMDGSATWIAGKQATIVWPAYQGAGAAVTSTVPTDTWPTEDGPKAVFEAGTLALLIILLAIAVIALFVPMYIFLTRQGSPEAWALLYDYGVESILDGMELAAAVLIFSNLNEGDVSDVQQAQLVLVSMSVLNILCLDAFTLYTAYSAQETAALVKVTGIRAINSCGMIAVVTAVAGTEVKMYLETLAVTDLICVIVLSVDLGYRVNSAVHNFLISPALAKDSPVESNETPEDFTKAPPQSNIEVEDAVPVTVDTPAISENGTARGCC